MVMTNETSGVRNPGRLRVHVSLLGSWALNASPRFQNFGTVPGHVPSSRRSVTVELLPLDRPCTPHGFTTLDICHRTGILDKFKRHGIQGMSTDGAMDSKPTERLAGER